MKIIVEIPDNNYELMSKLPKPKGTDSLSMFLRMIQNSIAISNDATNGDIIKAMFPNASIEVRNISVYVDLGNIVGFSRSWWDAPYKQESEV